MSDIEFPTIDVITVACAVHRQNGGFVKSNSYNLEDKTPNSKMLYNHFLGKTDKNGEVVKTVIETNNDDKNFAEEIIDYLKGLSFKAMERQLTDFENNVLKLVTNQSITKDMIGISASLPKVFLNKVDQDKWSDRESELARASGFAGKLHARENFELVIENIRNIPSVGSYLYCCSDPKGNIVKFFQQSEQKFKVGDKIQVTAYVKSHQESKFHGGKETMLNRIKYLDK